MYLDSLDSKPMVEILLSTYNGESYLREQLESLISQSYQNIVITIRDDASIDSTSDILREYVNSFPEKIRIIKSSANKGSTLSFFELLKESKCEYIMFCDQDDVWCVDKVRLSLNYLLDNKPIDNEPFMVFTDLEVVDENCKTISKSLLKRMKVNPSRLIRSPIYMMAQNAVAGCTVLFNRSAADKLLEIGDFPKEIVHDHWIAVITKIYGDVAFLDIPTIKYRQHSFNQVGDLDVSKKYLINKLFKIKNTIKHDYLFICKIKAHYNISIVKFLTVKIALNFYRFLK
ncbi:glycosyltransferase family 2 protein [Photobacterium leiognathi]|uniref:glycosyltransferase family 2 protein n=1 Tax=Photobacterium leiognathi TaxID=553611 RepID=UPI002981C62F|nr:glycosyltransferase family 2 protein [Photobacterium leiognathi]